METIIVLITAASSDGWARELAGILQPIGRLKVVKVADFSVYKLTTACKLVIIDATVVRTTNDLLEQLTTTEPPYRVIVMTASPDWRRARTAFEAGAMDYVSKNLPPNDVFNSIQAVLNKPPLRRVPLGANAQAG